MFSLGMISGIGFGVLILIGTVVGGFFYGLFTKRPS